jgi:hypothetical protein
VLLQDDLDVSGVLGQQDSTQLAIYEVLSVLPPRMAYPTIGSKRTWRRVYMLLC